MLVSSVTVIEFVTERNAAVVRFVVFCSCSLHRASIVLLLRKNLGLS